MRDMDHVTSVNIIRGFSQFRFPVSNDPPTVLIELVCMRQSDHGGSCSNGLYLRLFPWSFKVLW